MRILVLLIIMVLIAAFPFFSNWVAKNKGEIIHDKNYITDVIKEYVDGNPEHIISSVEKYILEKDMKAKEESKSITREALKNNMSKVNDNRYPSIGDGEVNVVEFFNYICGFCKQVSSSIESIIRRNEGDIRYTFREVAGFGGMSDAIARAALSVHMIDNSKYFDFNKAALNYKGSLNEELVKDIVRDLGVDLEEFEKVFNGLEVKDMLDESMKLMNVLGINGTPAFVVCDEELIIGADTVSLERAIDKCKLEKSKKDVSS